MPAARASSALSALARAWMRGGELGLRTLGHGLVRVGGHGARRALVEAHEAAQQHRLQVLAVGLQGPVHGLRGLHELRFLEGLLAVGVAVARVLPLALHGAAVELGGDLEGALGLVGEARGVEEPAAVGTLLEQAVHVGGSALGVAGGQLVQGLGGVALTALAVVGHRAGQEVLGLGLAVGDLVGQPQLGVQGRGHGQGVGRAVVEEEDLVEGGQGRAELLGIAAQRGLLGLLELLGHGLPGDSPLDVEGDGRGEHDANDEDLHQRGDEALLLAPVLLNGIRGVSGCHCTDASGRRRSAHRARRRGCQSRMWEWKSGARTYRHPEEGVNAVSADRLVAPGIPGSRSRRLGAFDQRPLTIFQVSPSRLRSIRARSESARWGLLIAGMR